MLKLIGILAFSLGILATPLMASTYTVGTTNVGGLDPFIFEDAKVGSTANEELWVQETLGDLSAEWVISKADVIYQSTDTYGIFAFNLYTAPDYFLIKNATRIALFENVADLSWGVFDSSVLSSVFNIPSSDIEISHVTEFVVDDDGGSIRNNPVPIPAAVWLFGSGLIGLLTVRKKVA